VIYQTFRRPFFFILFLHLPLPPPILPTTFAPSIIVSVSSCKCFATALSHIPSSIWSVSLLLLNTVLAFLKRFYPFFRQCLFFHFPLILFFFWTTRPPLTPPLCLDTHTRVSRFFSIGYWFPFISLLVFYPQWARPRPETVASFLWSGEFSPEPSDPRALPLIFFGSTDPLFYDFSAPFPLSFSRVLPFLPNYRLWFASRFVDYSPCRLSLARKLVLPCFFPHVLLEDVLASAYCL